MTVLYTAHAETKGGRNGQGQTTDGKLVFEFATPGGQTKKTGTVTNPEELFACGYSACFGSALEYVGGQRKTPVTDAAVKADVSLNQDEKGFAISVVLNVDLPSLDPGAARDLVMAAHQICPYSKATRGNIDVKLKVNGQDI